MIHEQSFDPFLVQFVIKCVGYPHNLKLLSFYVPGYDAHSPHAYPLLQECCANVVLLRRVRLPQQRDPARRGLRRARSPVSIII